MSPSVVIADRNEQTAAVRKKVRENVTPIGWLAKPASTVLGEHLDQSRTHPMAASPIGKTHSLCETGHDGRPLIECYRRRTKRHALLTAFTLFSRIAVTQRSHVLRSLGYRLGPLEQEEGESHALYGYYRIADGAFHARRRRHRAR